jgi:hypothetical protein
MMKAGWYNVKTLNGYNGVPIEIGLTINLHFIYRPMTTRAASNSNLFLGLQKGKSI